MDTAVGFHLSCGDCHQGPATSSGQPQTATHAACARCHAAEVKLARVSSMAQCTSCHRSLGQSQRKPQELIRGDLHFDHANHQRDRGGKAIACNDCHDAARKADNAVAAPPMSRCVVCHDDAARVGDTHRMTECQACHSDKRAALLALAPRNHLPASEVPVDHTIAFRTDHATAAADAVRCARCHREVSGSIGFRSSCEECHFSMKPRDHRLTWREYDHGADATATPDRCGLCHVADYCSACHKQRPRSHGVESPFIHGVSARINIRACLTCHDPVRSCQGSGCHQGMP
jgi:hypothetical protein